MNRILKKMPSSNRYRASIKKQDIKKFPFQKIINEISKVVFGKEEQAKLALTCIFANGHLLIEDLPGIGKTTLAKVLSQCLGLQFRRVQCTSDMLPGDILGISIFEKKSGTFVFHPGPVFTQVLLADEINRATPKTQSALLEAMEERQVTLEGKTRDLERPFFVIATQNPLEQTGTFDLPESQLDRFLMRIELGYPERRAEKRLLRMGETRQALLEINSIFSAADVIAIQKLVSQVHAADVILDYIQDLLDFTRFSSDFFVGLSPRAGLSILRAARSRAFIEGRNYVVPEDIQNVLPWVVGHRLRSAEDLNEIPRNALMALFMEIPIP